MEDIDTEKERKEILKRYGNLIRAASKRPKSVEDKKKIRMAFDIALEAHKDMRRKSGEPYIFHPLSVAMIVADEIGLGTTSIVCALLHDVVEDTDLTLDFVKMKFGENVAKIIDGLTKISGVFDSRGSIQAENFRKKKHKRNSHRLNSSCEFELNNGNSTKSFFTVRQTRAL